MSCSFAGSEKAFAEAGDSGNQPRGPDRTLAEHQQHEARIDHSRMLRPKIMDL